MADSRLALHRLTALQLQKAGEDGANRQRLNQSEPMRN